MKYLFSILLVLASFVVPLISAGQIKVLIVTGGHSFDKKLFYGMFDSFEGVDYDTITQPIGNELFLTSSINAYECIVFYDMFQPITDAQKEAYIRQLERGVGMVFLHHALVSYQDWPEFEKIIGGKYHLKESAGIDKSTYRHDVDFEVQIVKHATGHPVTSGLSDFMIHDEVYGNYTVNDDVTPLIKTTHPESTSTLGWAQKYKNSRIVYLQPGHDHNAYDNEHYRQLVRRAISWVSDKN
jgi:uncharacterized protein